MGILCLSRLGGSPVKCHGLSTGNGRLMSRLEDLKENATVQGILPNWLVTVVNTRWHGSAALELTCKTAEGRLANELLYRDDEPQIQVVEEGQPWSFDGDGKAPCSAQSCVARAAG